MLEAALEQLLIDNLTPYVDGVSLDSLHLGVFSGSLELRDLRVKPEALGLLGVEGVRCRSGAIRLLKLVVPWNKIHHGKLRAVVQGLHLEVEHIGDTSGDGSAQAAMVNEMRDMKQRAIELRMAQLRSLLDAQRSDMHDQGEAGGSGQNYAMRLVRKILNNIQVDVSDLNVAFVSEKRGLACNLELPRLVVTSTDQTFRERADNQEVTISGNSLYKIMRLSGLAVSMCIGGGSQKGSTEYILNPMSTCLKLAHLPSNQTLLLRFEVGTEEVVDLSLLRSQLKHLWRVQAACAEEAARLQELMVPPKTQRRITDDVAASLAEYGALYERFLVWEWLMAGDQHRPLSKIELQRMRLLEDALSIRLVARRRWLVHSKLEAVSEEATRRQREAEKARLQESQKSAPIWQRLSAYRGAEPAPIGGAHAVASFQQLSAEERDRLLQSGTGEDSKVEAVDLPERTKFELLLGKVSLDLVDDRWSGEVERQLLRLSLQNAHWSVDVNFLTDRRGQDIAEWRAEMRLSAFKATHAARTFVSFRPPEVLDDATAEDFSDSFPKLDSATAACVVLASPLQNEEKLLNVRLDFAPLEVRILDGALNKLLDFVRCPEELGDMPQGAAQLDAAAQYQEVVDISKDLVVAHGDKAKAVADLVCDHIPGKVMLQVRIASPIVHIAIAGLGSSTFSLGYLHLSTPEPCPYAAIDLNVSLKHTTLQAHTLQGERYDVIEPTSVQLQVKYRDFDNDSSLDVQAHAKQLALSLAPPSAQIVLATPSAMTRILSQVTNDRAAPAEAVEAAGLTHRAAEFVREVLSDAPGSSGTPPQPSERQLRLSLGLQLDALTVTLSDNVAPMARFSLEMLEPGLLLYWQTVPDILSLEVERCIFEAGVLTPRVGVWEPLVERFCLGLQVVRTPETDEQSSLRFIVDGHDPLLVNLTPSAVRQASWLCTAFRADSSSGAVVCDAAMTPASGVGREQVGSPASTGFFGCAPTAEYSKWRVVNLCEFPLEVELVSRHKSGLVAHIAPTGGAWESLDSLALPHFATAVVVRVSGGRPSEPILLERLGAALVPECGVVAQVLAPEPTHRVLLLATPLRIHNQTSLSLALRFHDPIQREVLMMDLPATTTCDAGVLGHAAQTPAEEVSEPLPLLEATPSPSGRSEGVVVLPPNAVGAVPALALARWRGASPGRARTWLSARPVLSGVGFSDTAEVGAGVAPRLVSCAGGGALGAGVHLLCETRTAPAAPKCLVEVTTVAILPPLSLANALPIGELHVGLELEAPRPAEAPFSHEVAIPRLTRMHLYCVPRRLAERGARVRARLAASAPWSHWVSVERSRFTDEGPADTAPAGLSLQVAQDRQGAPAGITIEARCPSELCFFSSAWFVDRSGLSRPLGFQLLHNKLPLPFSDGITLLPSDPFQEPCELLMRSSCDSFMTCSVRMPPSWSMLSMRTPCGPFVFCLQHDEVAAADMLGARCQVITMRPRLVIANASDLDIEVYVNENTILRLGAEQCTESHWHVPPGAEGEPPATSLRFRPLCAEDGTWEWSGHVACADAAVGSTPVFLRGHSGSERRRRHSVWSVEVVPDRGALSVRLRQGSEFVASNRAARAGATVAIRPLGGRDDSALEVDLPVGAEAEYGWADPFRDARRTVDVVVNGKACRVMDARRTVRRVIASESVAISVTRRDAQTLLSVEDLGPSEGNADQEPAGLLAAAPSWLQRVEVRLCRLGVSILEEAPVAHELLFAHLELVRFEWRLNDRGVMHIKLAISEAQVDCQLPSRDDAGDRQDGASLWQRDRPAVVFANCAEGDTAFLSLCVQLRTTSSRDVFLPLVEVAFDAMDVTVDDAWLEPLLRFLSQAGEDIGAQHGVPFADVALRAGRPIAEGYVAPAPPFVVQVDAMQISAITLRIWCALRLHSVRFLPAFVRTAIRVLSMSGQLVLDGARLSLPPRRLPPQRGSVADFLHSLAGEYTSSLLEHVGVVLGRSSLLNLPRAPLRLGGVAVSYVTDSIGLVAGEAASLLAQFSFDDEYVARQRHIRSSKRIQNLGDGVMEAGMSIVQGMEGALDIVKKPMEGAQRGQGLAGVLVGVGRGVAGGFAKPLSKLGQAISDVGAGIAAQAAPQSDSAPARRRRARLRQRQPRLLFSDPGALRPFDEVGAEVLRQLGPVTTRGVEEVVALTQQGTTRMVLLLFPRRLLLVEIRFSRPPTLEPRHPSAQQGRDGARGGKPQDLLDAADEAAAKILAQASKPFDTLLHSVQDLGGRSSASSGHAASSSSVDQRSSAHGGGRTSAGSPGAASPPARSARLLRFEDLRQVRTDEGCSLVELEDASGGTISLPLFASTLEEGARKALVEGFRSALTPPAGVTTWDALTAAVCSESRPRERAEAGGRSARLFAPPQRHGSRASRAAANQGHRVLEVFEVERRLPANLHATWCTPFLPIDGDLTWRWVEATGRRHPQLLPELTKAEATKCRAPPCGLDPSLFRSVTDFKISLSDQGPVDDQGWCYALAWHSSTWDSRPGLFDAVRKRRWTKAYR